VASHGWDRAVTAAFSHLALTVAKVEPMAKFYGEVFDMEASHHVFEGHGHRLSRVMEVPEAKIRGLFMRRDGLLLELLEYQSAHRASPGPRDDDEIGYAHLSFVVDDLERTGRRIDAAGGEYRVASRADFVFEGGATTSMAFCLDPEGNRIELVHHHEATSRTAHARFLGVENLAWLAGSGI